MAKISGFTTKSQIKMTGELLDSPVNMYTVYFFCVCDLNTSTKIRQNWSSLLTPGAGANLVKRTTSNIHDTHALIY